MNRQYLTQEQQKLAQEEERKQKLQELGMTQKELFDKKKDECVRNFMNEYHSTGKGSMKRVLSEAKATYQNWVYLILTAEDWYKRPNEFMSSEDVRNSFPISDAMYEEHEPGHEKTHPEIYYAMNATDKIGRASRTKYPELGGAYNDAINKKLVNKIIYISRNDPDPAARFNKVRNMLIEADKGDIPKLLGFDEPEDNE